MELQKKTSARQSQFELIRIVAMMFIVCHHLIIKGANTCGYINGYALDRDGYIGLIINSLCVLGKSVHFS